MSCDHEEHVDCPACADLDKDRRQADPPAHVSASAIAKEQRDGTDRRSYRVGRTLGEYESDRDARAKMPFKLRCIRDCGGTPRKSVVLVLLLPEYADAAAREPIKLATGHAVCINCMCVTTPADYLTDSTWKRIVDEAERAGLLKPDRQRCRLAFYDLLDIGVQPVLPVPEVWRKA